jgi:hypothetical protein
MGYRVDDDEEGGDVKQKKKEKEARRTSRPRLVERKRVVDEGNVWFNFCLYP